MLINFVYKTTLIDVSCRISIVKILVLHLGRALARHGLHIIRKFPVAV